MQVTRDDVLRFRVRAQELDRDRVARDDAAILDLGVQDTGPDGARVGAGAPRRGRSGPSDLVYAWTLRGAPHAYRRSEAAAVAAAVAPLSEADAAKRIFDASKPLKEAGIPVVDALGRDRRGDARHRAASRRSRARCRRELTERLPEPYLRWCRVCEATHSYEQTVPAVGAPGRPRARARHLPARAPPDPAAGAAAAKRVPAHLDPVRGVLRFLGPADAQAGRRVRRLPGQGDRGPLARGRRPGRGRRPARSTSSPTTPTRSPEPSRSTGCGCSGRSTCSSRAATASWCCPTRPPARTSGARSAGPGAVLDGHEVVGSWRPRSSGKKLRIAVTIWSGRQPPKGVAEQAERLAAFRGQAFDGFVDE